MGIAHCTFQKGVAKVTLKGTGSFAGTKTLSFKIKEKKGDYNSF